MRVLSDYFGRGRAGDRPVVFTLLFWFGLLAPLVYRIVAPHDTADLPGFFGLPGILGVLGVAAALVLVWGLLGWREPDDWPLSFGFPILALVYSAVDGSGLNLPVLWIALAHQRLTRGLATAVATGVGFVVFIAVSMGPLYGRTPAEVLSQGVVLVPVFGFFIALADLIGRERRERARAEGLLAELSRTNAELEAANQQIHELAVAEERARLAREVHDSVGHHLTVVRLLLANAEREPDAAAARDLVAQARTAAGDALTEVRRAVRALQPTQLDNAGLPGALERLAASYAQGSLQVSVQITGQPRRPAQLEATLFRVCEEALTNVHRHAQDASCAVVELDYSAQFVRLQVSDDGRDAAPPTPGFGLTSARARLAAVGGQLDVVPRPGGGLQLSAAVPIGEEAA